mmetsp:Transcript_25226/g.64241  ORF Transcript_25226/g.64241 Transcript_25226/m.64241 type:complete len:411 (-) Transcript_25226:81-1313(-)
MGLFSGLTMAPTDPILGTSLAFQADTDPRKVNLGVGAYRTEDGKPYVLNVVLETEAEILKETGTTINKEYSTIDGPADLKTLTQKLAFGDDSEAIASGRIASVQGLSGTGSLRVCAEFTKTFLSPEADEIWISKPTWGNHIAIFQVAGLIVKEYPYYEPETRGFDFEGMLKALKEDAKPGSMVLLHACAHNPTGVDPTEEQWKAIATVMQEKQLIPLMDSAYQGYASGSLDTDAFATRLFANMGFEMFMCQSFAKNLGLYGERIGMLHIVCSDSDKAKKVLSQLKLVIRPMYSNPPIHGAQLVIKILGDAERCKAWKQQLAEMATRIHEVRALLRGGLEKKGTPGNWDHITSQIGMFSYTGLSEPMCERLIKEHHIYLLKSGRISMAGLNKGNMEYMVNAVDEVVRTCGR